MMWRMLFALAAVAAVVATAASAARDPLTGAWVAVDVAGDGSIDRYIFSAPNDDGVRHFTLVDSYGSFCESGGPGTGAPLTAQGHAVLKGTTVETTFESFVCGNGTHGGFDPPISQSSQITPDGLSIGGYYVATRIDP
jgi:hypothetical protein